MKRIRIGALALFALVVACGVTLAVRAALAQRPTVKKQESHFSPLSAKITYPDGKTRMVMVLGMGAFVDNSYRPFTLSVKGEEGQEDVSIWLDTIRSISDITKEKGLITFKDEKGRRRVNWTGQIITDEFDLRNYTLFVARDDDGTEKIKMTNLDTVEFLKPARKDEDGHAMFDHWLYSPYTGKELPKVKLDTP